jgi:hypothetical protein
VIRRIEREHPLGQSGDDLALAGLARRRRRQGADRGQHARADEDVARATFGELVGTGGVVLHRKLLVRAVWIEGPGNRCASSFTGRRDGRVKAPPPCYNLAP